MSKFKFDWSKVKNDIKEGEKKPSYKDSRFWKPTVDDKGNATAVIRFLPDQNGTPFVKYYTHNFSYMLDGTKKFWINNCINTFGYDRECPICKKNQEYYNSSFDSDKAIAGQRKRKLIFVSNILVIKNPANPEDEGKVFLYQYGQKIFDKIKDKMFPSDEIKALGDYDEYVPFDPYEGADFKLVQVKQGEFPNYDKSEFGKQKPVGSDKVIDAFMEKTVDLSEFIAEDKFPTNAEVIQKLGKILGISTVASQNETANNTTTFTPDPDDNIPDFGSSDSSTSLPFDEPSDTDTPATGGDDDAEFFRNLR